MKAWKHLFNDASNMIQGETHEIQRISRNHEQIFR